ncbi:MAG: helix-turn-helix transcriptional regulator [Clostridia bacterium]|nr:helix-turn-helix transcriptional regulator [Clostridia bacterium]
MSIDYKLLGIRIKQKRKEIGKTQEVLAESLGVTVGYVSQIERGITKVNLETLSEICAILDTDLVFFLTGIVVNQKNYFQEDLIRKYSNLSDNKKKLLINFIDLLCESEI